MPPMSFLLLSTKAKTAVCAGVAAVTAVTGVGVGTIAQASMEVDDSYSGGVHLEAVQRGSVGYSVSPAIYETKIVVPEIEVEEVKLEVKQQPKKEEVIEQPKEEEQEQQKQDAPALVTELEVEKEEPAPEPAPAQEQAQEVEEEEEERPRTPIVYKKVVTDGKWNVSKDEKTDYVGNIVSIYNFLTTEWANAQQWCIEHYDGGSMAQQEPKFLQANLNGFTNVTTKFEARDFTPVEATAIIANIMRESSATPNSYEGRDTDVRFKFHSDWDSEYILDHLINEWCYTNNHGVGIIGFTGFNCRVLGSFCMNTGLDPASLEGQLYCMAFEYYSDNYTHRCYQGFHDACEGADMVYDDVYEGMYSYMAELERPANYTAGAAVSAKYLKNWNNNVYKLGTTTGTDGLLDFLRQYAETGVVPSA